MSERPVIGSVVHYVDGMDGRPRCCPAVVTEVGQYVTVSTLTTVPKSFDRSEGRPIREIKTEQWWYSDACEVFAPTLDRALVGGCRHMQIDVQTGVEIGTWHYPHPPTVEVSP